MVQSIIDSLKEYKSLCEFNATDFKADKLKLYEKVRQLMAGKYVRETYFGSVEKTVTEKPVKEMSKEEYGRIVIEHYDDLATIWGGSLSTESLAFGVDSRGTLSSEVSESDENQETVMPFSRSPSSTPPLAGDESISVFETIERPRSTTSSERSLSPSGISRQWSIPTNFDPEE